MTITNLEMDRYAWHSICDWSSHVEMEIEPSQYDPDYAELTRFFLWDKVGRCLRQRHDPGGFAFEQSLLASQEPSNTLKGVNLPAHPGLTVAVESDQTIAITALQSSSTDRITRPGAPIVFVPLTSPRLAPPIQRLSESGRIRVLTPLSTGCSSVKTHEVQVPDLSGVLDLATTLFGNALSGLSQLGINLLQSDANMLRRQIIDQMRRLLLIEAIMTVVEPDAILMYGDNFPPYQEYVSVGRRHGIPTIMLQHGLDCERRYLDEAYASAIAVWGPNRKLRYLRESRRQPDCLIISGNPRYDELDLPERIAASGDYWLWLTRPHIPEKCYPPSRTPREGVDILRVLLRALCAKPDARLVIKPHPLDYVGPYQALVERSTARGQVWITNRDLSSLAQNARVVLTEDTTAGMDAMFAGKPIVHIHLATSPPVSRFTEYGAAVPAYSTESVQPALRHAETLAVTEAKKMMDGQRAFLADHVGPFDGRATQRIASFIKDILTSTV